MINLTVITVGNLKESYWRDAVSEYEKRLSAFCKPTLIQLKEHKLPENPTQGEIHLKVMPRRSSVSVFLQ